MSRSSSAVVIAAFLCWFGWDSKGRTRRSKRGTGGPRRFRCGGSQPFYRNSPCHLQGPARFSGVPGPGGRRFGPQRIAHLACRGRQRLGRTGKNSLDNSLSALGAPSLVAVCFTEGAVLKSVGAVRTHRFRDSLMGTPGVDGCGAPFEPPAILRSGGQQPRSPPAGPHRPPANQRDRDTECGRQVSVRRSQADYRRGARVAGAGSACLPGRRCPPEVAVA